jgi:2-hydroxy-3-keto-5-methylthiopentenyl-1-phosphate phosphatase
MAINKNREIDEILENTFAILDIFVKMFGNIEMASAVAMNKNREIDEILENTFSIHDIFVKMFGNVKIYYKYQVSTVVLTNFVPISQFLD